MDVFLILSKIIVEFLSPLVWSLLLLMAALFVKSAIIKRRLIISATVILFLFSNGFIIEKVISAYQPAPVRLLDSAQYSCGILLSGMAMVDAKGQGYFSAAADRFIQTVELYHRKVIKKILVSGGSGTVVKRKYREADFLSKELIKAGIASEDILIENESDNTYENAIYSRRMLDSLQIPPPYVLITSALHMPRSIEIFKKAKIAVVPYPSNYLTIPSAITFDQLFIPKAGVLEAWKKLFKEWVGIAAYKLTNKA